MRENIAFTLTPEVQKRPCARTPDEDRRYRVEIFSRIPRHIAPCLLTEWEWRHYTQGRYATSVYTLNVRKELLPELCIDKVLRLATTHDEITDAAGGDSTRFFGDLVAQTGCKTQPSNPAITTSTPRHDLVDKERP